MVSENAPQPTTPTTTNLLRLPIEIRRIIYKLVLAVNTPLYLFGEGTRVRSFAPELPRRWLALLHTNRQISRETSAVVYSSNRFTLVDATQQDDLLQSFLNSIGSANASSLSYLTMGFPVVERVNEESGRARLGEESLRSLALLQKRCSGLTTLQAMIQSQNSSGLSTENQESLSFIEDAFLQIDTRVRAIPSLGSFFVRVYGPTLSSPVVEVMQELGWVVFLGDGNKPVQ